MKTKLTLWMLFFLVVTGTASVAQTTDRITNSIVYDVSGSVPIFDENHNIQTLLTQLIQSADQQTIKSYADFKIYFIGGDRDHVVGQNAYLSINSANVNRSKRLLDSISDQIKNSRHQKYTYIHTALENIIADKIAHKNDADHVAGGIFLFTDGQIGENDFQVDPLSNNFKDRDHYLAYINRQIGLLTQAYHQPVFIIQSSLKPDNSFTIIPDSSKYPNINKDTYTTPSWFWVKSVLKADTSKKIQAAFENFIDQANLNIVSNNALIPKNDVVGASLKLQQVFNTAGQQTPELLSRLLSTAVDNHNLQLAGVNTAQLNLALKIIVDHAGDSTLNKVTVDQLQAAIKTLSASPEFLRQLQSSVAKNVGDTVVLPDDQALASAAFPAVKADVAQAKASDNETLENKILNGIAKYLVDRVKQEVANYFIDEVNTQALNNKYNYREIGQFLLPNTKQAISNPANYTDINTLRTAFLKDVDNLPENICAHPELFGKSEGVVALGYFLELYKNIRQTNSLEISFQNLAGVIEKNIQKPNPFLVNAGRSAATVSRIEQSILFTSRMVTYLRTHDLSKIYLQQQPDTLTKMLTVLSLNSKYLTSITDLQKLGPIINDIYTKYQDLKNTITQYKTVLSSSPADHIADHTADRFAAVNDILGKISDLMLAGAPVLKLMKFSDEPVINALQRITQTISAGQTVISAITIAGRSYTFNFIRDKEAVDVQFKNSKDSLIEAKKVAGDYFEVQFDNMTYGLHILNFADISDLKKGLTFIMEPLVDQYAADFNTSTVIMDAQNCLQAYFLFREHKYADAVNLILPDINLALRDRFGSDTLALDRFNKVFRIAGGVVSANSSEDIENVISQNALPAGSYKTKRTYHETFYLNAYAGGSFTYYPANNTGAPALFAPVGFEYAFGGIPGGHHLHSFGVMLNVLDVGNIINYQLSNNGADQTNVTSFSRVFAPGLYLTYGLSDKTPLSLIAGYQMNPGRFNIGLVFDLPIYPFIQHKQ